MNLPKITMPAMPTVAGIRSSIEGTVNSIKEYSVTLTLPNLSKNVSVAPITADLAKANKVNTIFEGSVLKGFAVAVTTLLVGVIALGCVAALVSNPIGLSVLALAVTLFVIGSALKVSHTPPPVVAKEVVQEPAPLTTTQYLASLVGLGWCVGVQA